MTIAAVTAAEKYGCSTSIGSGGAKDWTLQHYIDVAHELGWISATAKDIGVVLRDYRNYIHPHKELTHGISLSKNDATLLWEISKSITRQVL